jgi:hypothetical protein
MSLERALTAAGIMRLGRAMRLARIAILPLLLSACGLIGPDDEGEVEHDRLDRNVALWEGTEPARYAFFLQRLCFCGAELTQRVRIEVANGVVVSRTYADNGLPVPAQWHNLFPAMEGIFLIVREALDRKAAEFEVQYDPIRGYPRTGIFDYVLNAADEELTFQVTGFSVE